MTLVVDITVFGIPQQQGSKNPWGGDANKNLKPWRTAVMEEGKTVMSGQERLLDGPISVEVTFAFPRPKAHYRANGDLKPNAPTLHSNKPDADKLCRGLGDALTGVVITDDSRIAVWHARKTYAERPYTRAIITQLREATDGTAWTPTRKDPGRAADAACAGVGRELQDDGVV